MAEKKRLLEVTLKEELLLLAIRNRFQFGEIIVIARDGQPVRIKRAFETNDLEN